MEKKPPLVMTPFDESLTNDFLQLVKIILPYLPDHVQRIAGIYVKLTELMNAFYCFQPPHIIKCFLLKIQGFPTFHISVNKPQL